MVAHGNERGRLPGYPTANVELEDARVAVPAGGVYAVSVRVGGCDFGGMANIGSNPTFGLAYSKAFANYKLATFL